MNAICIIVGLGDAEAEEDLRKELAALSLVGSYKHIVGMMGASYTEGDSIKMMLVSINCVIWIFVRLIVWP